MASVLGHKRLLGFAGFTRGRPGGLGQAPSYRPVLVVLVGGALAERPLENLLNRIELNLGQMRRVRTTDVSDLDRTGQPAGGGSRRAGHLLDPNRRRLLIPGYRDTLPTSRPATPDNRPDPGQEVPDG